MYDDTQSILRCGLCNKPFDRQTTLKRHGYYCRSRRTGSTTRPRSCISCAKNKAGCDNKRPGCSRCMTKGIECHYPTNVSATKIRRSNALSLVTDSISSIETETHHVANNDGDGEGNGDGFLDTAVAISNPTPDFADLDWNDLDINFPDFLGLSGTDEKSAEYPSLGLPAQSPPVYHPTPSPSTVQIPPQQPNSPPRVLTSIPALPKLPRLIVQRQNTKAGAERTTTLILHTLKSYILMMLRDSTLPPFMHSSSIYLSSNVDMDASDNGKQLNPLSNCINLMSTFNNKSQRSRRFFWENIRIECERFCAEYQQFSKWDLLGAMQSLSIYILIRLDEGETEDNHLDFLLLAAVTAIANQISANSSLDSKILQSAISNPNPRESWKEWIFEESRRRLSIIYRILHKLIYFEPAANCGPPSDLLLAPLPAKKQLWEADNAEKWKAEVKREEDVYQSGFAVSASGELIRLQKKYGIGQGDEEKDEVLVHTALEETSVVRKKARWEEWCVGMDGMGGIVLLAASLV